MAIVGHKERLRSSVEELLLQEMVEDDMYDIVTEDTILQNIIDEGCCKNKGLFDSDDDEDDDFDDDDEDDDFDDDDEDDD